MDLVKTERHGSLLLQFISSGQSATKSRLTDLNTEDRYREALQIPGFWTCIINAQG